VLPSRGAVIWRIGGRANQTTIDAQEQIKYLVGEYGADLHNTRIYFDLFWYLDTRAAELSVISPTDYAGMA
jgi:hypothetical protein